MKTSPVATCLWLGFATLCAGGAEPLRDIPDASWVRYYFESIDEVAGDASQPPLRTASPGPDHLEARFWFGFGLGGMNGFIVRREDGKWTGVELNRNARAGKPSSKAFQPRGGWETAWRAIEEKRLLTLPDFSALPPSPYTMMDGSSGVVEVFAGGKYRTYMYPNSWSFDNPECREFEALIATFSREYLGREGKVAERRFLSAEEIQGLNARLREIEYPLMTRDLLEKLPVRLFERGIRSEGLQGQNGEWWAEWPLTSRANLKGYYALLGYIRKTGINDVNAERITIRAEVVFKNPFYGERWVLQPQDIPVIP